MIDKVSIIMPAYNVEDEVEESLNSVLLQTYTNLEIIIINDGSTDNTFKIINRLAKKDSRIKIINQENMGQSVARNKGIDHSSGEYIYFFDADDFLMQGAISELVCYANKYQSDIVTFDAETLVNNQTKSYIRHKNLIPHIIYDKKHFLENSKWNLSPVWIYFFRKDFLEKNKIKFREHIIYEDNLFYADILFYCSRIVYVDEAYFLYKRRKNSTTGNLYNKEFRITSLEVVKQQLDNYILKENKEDIFYDFLIYRRNVAMVNIISFHSNDSILKSMRYMYQNNLITYFNISYFCRRLLKKILWIR